MDTDKLTTLLEAVARGDVPVEMALAELRHMPYADLDFAKVDTHRALRTGFPEVVFGQGKTANQIAAIMERLMAHHAKILATRIDPATAGAVMAELPGLHYHPEPRALTSGYAPVQGDPAVAVLCAGTSYIPVAAEAALTVEMRGLPVARIYDVGVAGLHRLLEARRVFSQARAVVVVAGMEGALPSVVGGLVDLPVVAVPTSVGYGASFGGVAALLGMLNSCASNVTVVNIDAGFKGGYVAGLIARNAARARGKIAG